MLYFCPPTQKTMGLSWGWTRKRWLSYSCSEVLVLRRICHRRITFRRLGVEWYSWSPTGEARGAPSERSWGIAKDYALLAEEKEFQADIFGRKNDFKPSISSPLTLLSESVLQDYPVNDFSAGNTLPSKETIFFRVEFFIGH